MKGNIKQGQELEALINQITSIPMTVAIKEEDLDYLHQAKAILKRRIHSFPKDDEPRVDSVIREFEDFGNIDYSQYDRIVIQIVTSSAYPGENGAFPPTRDGCIHSLSMRKRG